MLKNKKLFLIDLDGTSLTDRDNLEETLIETVNVAKKEGHEVVIVTGRPLSGCETFYNQLGLDSVIGTLNGNRVIEMKTNKIIDECKMDSTAFKKFIKLEKLNKHVVDFAWEYEGQIYSSHNVVDLMTMWYHHRPWKEVENVEEIPNEITCGFIMIDPIDTKLFEDFFQNWPEVICHKWENLFNGHQVYELFNSTCTKGTAAEAIAKHYKIPLENTYAFGDGKNDIQMFELEQLTGIAVGNAHPELIKYADKVSEFTNIEGSVSKEILKIIKKDQ